VALRRPDSVIPLSPHSRDRFDAGSGIGLITLHRGNAGVTELGVTQDRVWDLRFKKTSGGPFHRPNLGFTMLLKIEPKRYVRPNEKSNW
jgi:hypothetical protein